jgi:hypothetical protein
MFEFAGWILLILVLFGIIVWMFFIGFRESYRSRKKEDNKE